jgi:hypothetical protein
MSARGGRRLACKRRTALRARMAPTSRAVCSCVGRPHHPPDAAQRTKAARVKARPLAVALHQDLLQHAAVLRDGLAVVGRRHGGYRRTLPGVSPCGARSIRRRRTGCGARSVWRTRTPRFPVLAAAAWVGMVTGFRPE